MLHKTKKYKRKLAVRKDSLVRHRPLNVKQMEKVLAGISYLSTLIGLSAVLFSLTFWYGLLKFIFGNNNIVVDISGLQVLVLFFTGFIFIAAYFLLKAKFKDCYKQPIKAYPNAARYYKQCAAVSRIKIIICFVLCAIGYILSICVPNYFRYNDLRIVLAILAIIIAVSAFYAASFLAERRIYKKMTVYFVKDSENQDWFDTYMERRKKIIRWSIYWFLVLGGYLIISIIFQSLFMYVFYLILAVVNFLLRLITNNPFRRFSSVRSKRITVRFQNIALTLIMAGLCFFIIENGFDYNGEYIESFDYKGFKHNSSFEYNSETGVYTVAGTTEEFRILQLTDIHICGSIATIQTDQRAFNACYNLIRETQPDFIIITGDLIYPIPIQTFNRDNLGAIFQLCTFMNHIGIPWAMVYGNHDTEAVASYQAKELSGIYYYFNQQPDCPMLYAAKQPDIYGRYNQYIRVVNSNGSLNRLLFLIDSNDYVNEMGKDKDYDSVHTDQIQWYADTIDQISAEEERIVPSFVFMHIPFQEFSDAQEALKSGSKDARYLFGENEESVSCPKYNSGFFDVILEKQSTEAVFVGHDHLNNMAIKYKGVDLVYSKSIDYYAYPGIADKTKQRGATLITLFQDGTYHMEQVDYQQ